MNHPRCSRWMKVSASFREEENPTRWPPVMITVLVSSHHACSAQHVKSIFLCVCVRAGFLSASLAECRRPGAEKVFLQQELRDQHADPQPMPVLPTAEMSGPGHVPVRYVPTDSPFSSVQFKMVSVHSVEPMCVSLHISDVLPVLPLKLFSCSSDCWWPTLVLWRKIIQCFLFPRLSPPGDQWCDVEVHSQTIMGSFLFSGRRENIVMDPVRHDCKT